MRPYTTLSRLKAYFIGCLLALPFYIVFQAIYIPYSLLRSIIRTDKHEGEKITVAMQPVKNRPKDYYNKDRLN